MIKLACRYHQQDYSELVYQSVMKYVDESADLEVTKKAVWYLLEQLNSREQREKLLETLLRNLGGKNPSLDSELATELGLLKLETADPNAARYFMNAYNNNKYNRLAFAEMDELVPEQIEPAMHLEHLRLELGKNPIALEAALAFAQYAEKLQLYDTAAEVYEYCAELFAYLNPSGALPASIYLPWAISNYNTRRNQHKCLEIASDLRQSGRFNLLAEAIAGRAAAKIGNEQRSRQLLMAAEERAYSYLLNRESNHKPQTTCAPGTNHEQLAWFYCFASPDADKALRWANKAYSIKPNSPTAAAILAYSLVMNGQMKWANMLIDNYQHNQIADLTLAQIQLAQEQKDLAIETLKSAIARDPGSLEAERAKEILAQQGREYIPPIDPDITLMLLRNNFKQAIVPQFTRPEDIISVQLNLRGNKFSYGSKFGGTVVITNNSSEPLVIGDDGLFAGNIRVDADISGDINKKIPALVSVRIRPALPVGPGRSIFIPLRLLTAELRQILLTYTQASLDIDFTVYLDPVTTDHAGTANRLQGIKPAKVTVKRPGKVLSGRFLRNRFNSLSRGKQGQKIATTKLFIGLLMEQNAMANRPPLYKFMYADWMPTLLKSALVHNLNDEDWSVKVHTMAGMLSLPLDYELMNAVAENLNDTHWPTRLMAVYLLAKNQGGGFAKVLNWTAKYDSEKLVRNMAITLGAAEPQDRELENKLLLGKSRNSSPTR